MNAFKRAQTFISRKSDSNRLIALFAVIWLISQITIGWILGPIGSLNVLALQTTLSSADFKSIVASWIALGQIAAYHAHFFLDNMHPIWYSLFLSLTIARLFKINAINSKFDWMLMTPFVAGACDLFENAMHLYFLADLNRATPALVALSGVTSLTKWFLVCAGLAVVCSLAITWCVRKVLRRFDTTKPAELNKPFNKTP